MDTNEHECGGGLKDDESPMGLMGPIRPVRSAGPAAHGGTVASRGRESAGAAGTTNGHECGGGFEPRMDTNAGGVLNHEWTRMQGWF